jgi:proteasome accessory factor B
MHPLERLINLVALLLDTRRPLSFEEIRSRLPAYRQADQSSAKRMFERDKDILREVGIPVEVGPTDVWDVEQGYRIPPERYYLPEISFTSEEVWALFVAAHAPGEDGEAERAFLKLSSGVDAEVLAGLGERREAPGVDASGRHLGLVADALARRRSLRFRYRAANGKVGDRHVDPFGLVYRRGHWYVVGLDRARDDIRSFRLSRLRSVVKDGGPASAPPEGFSAGEHVQSGPWGLGRPAARARVEFSPKVAWMAASAVPEARTVRTRRDGWVELDVPASETDAFVSWILSFGADAHVRSPRAIRDRVVERLRAFAREG